MILRPFKALIFSLLITSLLLSACQGNTAVPTPTPQPSQPSTPLPEKEPAATLTPTLDPTVTPVPLRSLKGQVIEFWHPWQDDLSKQVDDLVSEFNRYNEWGIKVNARSFYNTSALEDALAEAWKQKSALPAVIAAPSDLIAAWNVDGQIVALNDYLKDPQYLLSSEEIKDFNPLYLSQDQSNGKQIAIPALRSAQVLFYNQTWARELGFPTPPINPEQFKQQACAAAKVNNRSKYLEMFGTGGYLVDTGALTALSWLSAFGANVVSETGTAASPYTFQSPESKKALEYLRKMLDDGCAWVGRSPTPNDYFARRMALFYSGTLSDLADQQRIQAINKNNDQWTILPFPGENGKPVIYTSGFSFAVLKSSAANSADAEETELAAWLLIRWMAKPKNASRLAEAVPSFPVSQSIQAELKSKEKVFPWDLVLPLSASADAVRSAPGLASWREVRRLLEDSVHQVYYQPAEQINQVLPMLDQMIAEVLKK